MKKLINTLTGEKVIIGEVVKDFRGDEAVIVGFTPPHKPSSSGRVHVRPIESRADEMSTREYYPSVFNLKFLE